MSIGVAEPSSPALLRIYYCEEKGTELAPAREVAWNPDPKLFAGRKASGVWSAKPLLPNGYLQAYKPGPEKVFFVHPIARNRRI